MQKLIYVPPGSEFGDNSNVVLQLAPPYILGTVSGTGGADISILSDNIPGSAGERVYGVQIESRIIGCTIHIEGKTREEMYSNRFVLARQLVPSEIPGYLYYSNDHMTLRTKAIPQKSPEFTARIQNYNKAEIKFYCPSPYWESIEETEIDVAYAGSGFRFPVKIEPSMQFGVVQHTQTVNNYEPIPVPLEIVIYAPATNPIHIVNETTGEEIKLLRSLFEDETLTIRTAVEEVAVILTKEDGSTEDAFHYLEPESEFFSLVPGENVLHYVSWNESEITTVKVRYRALYAGV